MPEVELTNMVMIRDEKTGRVVVIDRVKSWKGLSFPGGHVENGESFVDSAVREVKEETGLTVANLKPCGVIHWCRRSTSERYLVFLYRTGDYSGELRSCSDEGKGFWIAPEEIEKHPSQNDFTRYLPMFLQEGHSEAFGLWEKGSPFAIEYK